MTVVASSRVQTWLALIILLAVAGWHGWWTTRGWNIPGLAGHEFRQTQTALSIDAMKRDGFRMDYSTPILGKPWSIPFEFPIYQGIVYAIIKKTGWSAIEAGRCVTLAMFYLSLPALVLLLRVAKFSPVAAVLGVTPVLFAPVYLFYSRAVLIESTAFCASAWFLYLLASYRVERRTTQFAGMMLCGVLAVLVKSTTWAVFCLPWAAWVFHDLWKARRRGWRAFLVVAEDVVLIGIPLLVVGFGWVWITDQIKEMNPVGTFLTSKNLTTFNFGTLAQHIDINVWKALWSHWMVAVMPWWGFLAAAVALIVAPARSRIVFGLGAWAFFCGQFVFINLYAIHDYYFYANAAGACLAVGAVSAGLWDRGGAWYRGKALAVLLLLAVLAGQFTAYHRGFYQTQTSASNGVTGLTQAIRALINPNEVVVVHAPSWGSELAFRSERRMLMIPDSQMFFHPDAVRRGIALLKDESVPLVIFWDESRGHADWIRERSKDFDLELMPLFLWQDHACVYAKRSRFAEMRALLGRHQFEGVMLAPPESATDLGATGTSWLRTVGIAPPGKLQDVKEPVPIAGTPLAAEMNMLDPIPLSGSFPFGVKYYQLGGGKQLFVHSPTELYFAIPRGATRVEIRYRMDQNAYKSPDFDGEYFILEVRAPGQPTALLHWDWLAPFNDRKPRELVVPLDGHNEGTLVFRALPGPGNNSSADWGLLDYLRIR